MVTLVQTEKGDTLKDLYDKALNKCKASQKVSNLILSGTFPFVEVSSDWIDSYKGKAQDWQSPVKPNHLVLNHGEYIDRYKTKFNMSGLGYIVEELKTKADSNRACWSLYDMSTLISSEDRSIPSFMVLQAGISESNSLLSLTAYYRALEASNFLPINIAENCLVAEKIQKEFSFKFKNFSLTIHACNAYAKENFSCLEKATIDLLDEASIMLEITTGETYREWIKENLINKKETIESRIDSRGIDMLIKCIELFSSRSKKHMSIVYSPEFIRKLKSISKKIKEHNDIVFSSTYTIKAKSKYEEIIDEINSAINLI